MKARAWSLAFVLGLWACFGAPCSAEEPAVLVTSMACPLFDGPGAYYELLTLLPGDFTVQIPGKTVAKPRWWLRVSGFPRNETRFKQLMSSAGGDETSRILWVSVRNVKPESDASDELGEFAAAPLELSELSASFAMRGFVDQVASAPAGRALTRAELTYILGLPFSPEDVRKFWQATEPCKPHRQIEATTSHEERLDFLGQLQMGLHVVNRLSKKLKGAIIEHQDADRYVNLVAAYVAENPLSFDRRFRIVLWQNDELLGAFSCPGGFVVVTTGLLRECRDEAELAGLLAHEMVHVCLEHGLRVKEYADEATGITGLFELEQELDREVEDKFGLPPEWRSQEYAHLEDMAGDFLEKTLLKSYLIEDEHEADRWAAILTYNAGYDPRALGRLLVRLEGAGHGQGSLTNHGPVEDRLRVLNATIRDLQLSNPNAGTFEGRFRSAVQGLPAGTAREVQPETDAG